MSGKIKMEPFENLPTSTATVMTYSSCNFHLENVFRHIPITVIDPPLTKKKKMIDKDRLEAPYGAIIGLQHSIYIRGIRTSKKKKYWCPMCQLVETGDDTEKKILTIEEHVRRVSVEERKEKGFPPQTQKIHFICNNCEREFEIRQLRKIVPFLNQVTIVISIGDVIINAMLFRDSCKMAGNKNLHDAIEMMMILWEDYISLVPDGWSYRKIKNPDTGVMETCTDVHFLFELVMRNVGIKLGFPIDKKKLNKLMNRSRYKNRVFISKCEPTSDTHVNVKMYTSKPDDFKYDVLVYEKGCRSDPYFIQMSEKKYAKKKPDKEKYITFIVFSSAEIILTGRYDKDMKRQYEFFVKTAMKHREKIEEVINKPKMSIREYLKSLE